MKRSIQEIVELVAFGLIALVLGTGLLWVAGWALGWVGTALRFVAGFIASILWYIVPLVIIAGAIYALVKLAQKQRTHESLEASTGQAHTPSSPPASAGEPSGQADQVNASSEGNNSSEEKKEE